MFKADWEKTSVTCALTEGLVKKMVRLAYSNNIMPPTFQTLSL